MSPRSDARAPSDEYDYQAACQYHVRGYAHRSSVPESAPRV